MLQARQFEERRISSDRRTLTQEVNRDPGFSNYFPLYYSKHFVLLKLRGQRLHVWQSLAGYREAQLQARIAQFRSFFGIDAADVVMEKTDQQAVNMCAIETVRNWVCDCGVDVSLSRDEAFRLLLEFVVEDTS